MASVISRDAGVRARPWRLQELHAGNPAADLVAAAPQEPVEPEVEPIVLPTIAELEAIRDKGYQEGFELGRAEAQSRLTGDIKAIAQGVDRLSQQLAAIDGIYERFFAGVGRAIADAVDIVPPAKLAKTVQQALATIAQPEGLVLCLHPEDAVCLREVAPDVLDRPGIRVNELDTMSRGGFSIRSPFGEVDATLESSLQNLKKALRDASV